jgi:hypothetical protein
MRDENGDAFKEMVSAVGRLAPSIVARSVGWSAEDIGKFGFPEVRLRNMHEISEVITHSNT